MAIFNPDEFKKKILEASVRQAAAKALKSENKARNSAEATDQARPIFLRPNDVAGEYDFSRALKTTLGGNVLRDITLDDLRVFQKNINTIGAMYKGGITIPQIISLSREADIQRANREIHISQPVRRRAGTVEFITNAGPKSKDTTHTVIVEFLAFDSVVLEPQRQRASTIKNRLANGKVRIECDCGRFTYWYRYLATLGGFVHGRKEGAFPKERNPELTGIACKHILRTVHFCRTPLGQLYLEKAVAKDRSKQHGRRYSASPKTLASMLDAQIAQKGTVSHKIRPNYTKAAKEMQQRIEKQNKKIEVTQGKLDEKARRIARLKANYEAKLIDKQDFDFYMRVENERKY